MASFPRRGGPPPSDGDADETHFEWLARTLPAKDRRIEPFTYRVNPPHSERRRWDAFASLAAQRSGRS